MSMHKVPLTPTEEAGFHAHGLQRNIGKPSQLADVFRQGVAWGIAAERERWQRIATNAQAVTTGGQDKLDHFEVPSHLMAALALALDEGPNAEAQGPAPRGMPDD
jgi:hypothetical protein